MTAWNLNLGFTDSAQMFARMMGFVTEMDGAEYLALDRLLDHYGRSESRQMMLVLQPAEAGLAKYQLYDAYELQFVPLTHGIDEYVSADLVMRIIPLKYAKEGRYPLELKLKHEPYGRQYRCGELGENGIELSAMQLTTIIRELSNLQEFRNEWLSYMNQ